MLAPRMHERWVPMARQISQASPGLLNPSDWVSHVHIPNASSFLHLFDSASTTEQVVTETMRPPCIRRVV